MTIQDSFRGAVVLAGRAARISLGAGGFVFIVGGLLLADPLGYPLVGYLLAAAGAVAILRAVF